MASLDHNELNINAVIVLFCFDHNVVGGGFMWNILYIRPYCLTGTVAIL